MINYLDVKSRKEKLEQVASFSLFGNVMSMASVQLVGASRDALLLSFKDAKVSPHIAIALLFHVALTIDLHNAVMLNISTQSFVLTCLPACFPQLSVVEYDPGTHDLKTLSLHYFEEPELRVHCAYFYPSDIIHLFF